MNRFSDFSIKSKLILAILSLLVLALMTYSALILYFNYQHNMTALLKQSKLQSQLIADYVVTPLLFSDISGAQEVLSKLESVKSINAAVIYDENGKLFTAYTKNRSQKIFSETVTLFEDSSSFIENEIILSTPIEHKGHIYGVVMFYVSTAEIPKALLNYALILLLTMLVLIFFSLFIINKLQEYITSPIINLAKIAKRISLSEDYTIRAQKMHSDEVGYLYNDFNSMLDKIEQRGRERDEAETISRTYQAHLERLTNELEARVKGRTLELQESLEHLQTTQVQLVESEKMSALGNLVAGVAHEVNTPLGISITAASIFKNEINKIQKLLDENKLSKSALMHFVDTIVEADDILIKNLDRAATLVKNFKKISVDQSNVEVRDFELNAYLQEVLSTFKNELRHRPISLELKLDEKPINMYSFPGAISQVIVNMLQNALVHAFDFDQIGKITIETIHKNEHVIIRFADDGKGIDPSISDKIFEPFVTTKRNLGGTGLGLNITYNLITQQLGGTIKIDTNHSEGACFIIEIPCMITQKTKD